jgi:hypothetical protein
VNNNLKKSKSGTGFYFLEECHITANEKKGFCLSTEFKDVRDPLKWRCQDGHEWSASYQSIMNGKWCKKCRWASKRPNLQTLKDHATKMGGKLLSDEVLPRRIPLLWECHYGHQWSASYPSILTIGTWCPDCYQKGYSNEKRCRQIFESIFNEKFPKTKPFWLINPKTGRKLELDGYCEKLNLAFEYQGIQHYEKKNHFHKNEQDFKNQIKRDKIKKQLTENRGIVTIYIHQLGKKFLYEDLEPFILSELKQNRINIPDKNLWAKIQFESKYQEATFEQIKERKEKNQLARKNGKRDILTKEDIRTILKLQREGKGPTEISRIINQGFMAVYKVFKRIMKLRDIAEIEYEDFGIPIPLEIVNLQKKVTPEIVNLILNLRKSGLSYEKISKSCGFSTNTVRKICVKKMGTEKEIRKAKMTVDLNELRLRNK